MKRRLSRSIRGFARRVQMGHAESLFVITEGKRTDRWFYDRLIRHDDNLARSGFLVYTIASITRDFNQNSSRPQGKRGVLDLFKELRSSGQLQQRNSSGIKSMVFCVDADHDRFTRRMLRSDHLVYTSLPDVEAHVIDSTDLAESFAIAASIPQSEARQIVTVLGDWQGQFALARLEWMILCCAAETSGSANCPRAGTPPAKSRNPLSPASITEVEDLRRRLEDEFAANSEVFQRNLARARARFEKAVSSGNAARTLKGKWCLKFLRARLEDEVEKIIGETIAISEEAVLSAAKAQASFAGPWHVGVREQITRTLGERHSSACGLPTAL